MSDRLEAGFARLDITPEFGGIPLRGYAASDRRLARRVLDPLEVNAVALRCGKETCVMLTLDICSIYDDVFAMWRDAVRKETGLPADHIFIGATHTHSSIDFESQLPSAVHFVREEMPEKLPLAARRALADLMPAKLSYGSIEVGTEGCRLNFNRYYYMTEIAKKDNYKPEDSFCVGDNFGWQYTKRQDKYCYVGHEEEADHSLQILRFTRENADDILLLNFAAHATITGGMYTPDLSSDYPYAFRKKLEERIPGVKCSFLQGCAGNINASTRMKSEGVRGLTLATKGFRCDHYAYGAVLASYAEYLLADGMRESESDALAVLQETQTANRDHSMDALVPKTKELIERFNEVGYTDEVRQLCLEKGFNSIYHAQYAILKSKEPKTGSFVLHALRVGDCAIVFAPFELFSATGIHIKEQSPFRLTMVKAYSCGYHCYLPSANSTPDSYESNVAYYERGTAEQLEKTVNGMLKKLQ